MKPTRVLQLLGIVLLSLVSLATVNAQEWSPLNTQPNFAAAATAATAPLAADPASAVNVTALKPVSVDEPIDRSRPTSVQTTPKAECFVYPEGAKGDPSRTEFLSADSNGVIRFYPPPSSWGTRLTLDCAAQGQSETHLVDLNDASTFFKEAELDHPTIVGTRPALSGDLMAIAPEQLLKGGYPPRPDPLRSPEAYAKWETMVTRPASILQVNGVAELGRAASTFDGRFGNGLWSGELMDAQGWSGGAPIQNGSTLYAEYIFNIDPLNVKFACKPVTAPCSAVIWGGIAGFNNGALIQSGFQLNGTLNAFYEYFQAGPNGTWVGPIIDIPASQFPFSNGDEITTFGYAGDVNEDLNTAGPFGYYFFEDVTTGFVTNILSLTANTSGTFAYPINAQTFEAIAEKNTGFQLTPFGTAAKMSVLGFEQDFVQHDVFSDPYIFLNLVNGSGRILANPYFGTATRHKADTNTQSTFSIKWDALQ